MADGDMELLEQMRRRRSGWGEEDWVASRFSQRICPTAIRLVETLLARLAAREQGQDQGGLK